MVEELLRRGLSFASRPIRWSMPAWSIQTEPAGLTAWTSVSGRFLGHGPGRWPSRARATAKADPSTPHAMLPAGIEVAFMFHASFTGCGGPAIGPSVPPACRLSGCHAVRARRTLGSGPLCLIHAPPAGRR